jgi:multiple sugar transport system substrate-binding protein
MVLARQQTRVTRRSVLGAAPAGAAALTLAACGQGGPGVPAATGQAVKVIYMSLGAPGSDRARQEAELFQAFNQERRNIEVEVEATGASGWGGLKEKFIIRHTGGDPADLVMNNWGTWTDMAEGGMLTELTPFFKRDKISYDLFIPTAIESHSVDGKVWAMPVSMSVDALAYNLDLFDRAGLKYPPVNPEDKTWTMERFLEYAQKLTQGNEQFGFGGTYTGFGTIGVADGTYFGQLAWDDKRKKCLIDTPLFQKGLQFWLDVATRYRVQPDAQERAALMGGMTGDIFLTGKIGMQVTLSGYPRDRVSFRWGVATLPYSGQGRNISSRMWATALPMGRTPRAEQAWEVLKWLTRPENGGRFPLVAGHSVSPLVKGGSDIAQKVRQQESGIDPKAWLLQAQYSPVSASGMLKYAAWPKAVEELTPKWNDFRGQRIGTSEYARTATETIDRLLGQRR